MRKLFLSAVFLIFSGPFTAALAQQSVWVQIEALPTQQAALTRAQIYSNALQSVSGHGLRSGWHAVVLGPFAPVEATQVLRQLRITRQIPGDSYIVDGRQFTDQFWPNGSVVQTAQPAQPAVQPEPVALPTVVPAQETRAQARASERQLSREERQLIQRALAWEGFYNAAIDGAFGPGTRNSMADWQTQQNFEQTGVLTSKQRALLIERYQQVLASLGMEPVLDAQTGIEIDLPMAMIELDRYQPPFAHFKSRGDSGVKLMLISQTGDDATLRGLYDILQTLEIVPLNGKRVFGRNNFTLAGENDQIASHTFAALKDGQVKGFTLIWPAGPDKRRDLVIQQMRASFRPFPEAVLPDIWGDPNAAQSIDLVAGLAVRRAEMTRSGFYVSGDGAVLTTADFADQCTRITIDGQTEADLIAVDTASGLALLKPREPLQPLGHARIQTGTARLNSEIAVSGYSFGGVLGAPTLTYGTLADLKGLRGEASLNRLALAPTGGDAGGPVFDTSGSVMGMLLAPAQDTAKRLPEGVSFSADRSVIIDFLTSNGLTPTASDLTGPIAPEDLTVQAGDMTVLVSCWN